MPAIEITKKNFSSEVGFEPTNPDVSNQRSQTKHNASRSKNKCKFKKTQQNSKRHIFSFEYTNFLGPNTGLFRLDIWNLEQVFNV